MEFLSRHIDPDFLALWERLIDDWFFLFAICFLAFELIRYGIKQKLSMDLAKDTLTNFVTLAMFIGIIFLIGAAYIAVFFIVYEYYSLTQLPLNGWTLVLCIVLADIAYYWEHRAMHRIGIGWATHSVHHSSQHFNISVAYRFGPLDGVFPIFFHLPLAFLGFHPFMILFSEKIVQVYQTLLHTETIGTPPRHLKEAF